MNNETKKASWFDIFHAMPEGSIDVFMNTGGGRMAGKKDNKFGIIEMIVDSDTFQDFAFQSTYGEPKTGKKERRYILLSVDVDEYDKQFKRLNGAQLIEKQ